MIPIVTWTLWRRRWYILGWALGIAVYMALQVGVYPAFRDQAASLNESLKQLPEAVKAFISDSSDMFSPAGYLNAQAYYLALPMIFSVMTIGLGRYLIARDEEDRTLELVLARPVTRGSVLAGRATAGLLILLIVVLAAALTTMGFAWLVDLHINLWWVGLATLMAGLMALLFGAVSFMFTALGRSGRLASIGVATMLLIASYMVTSLSGTVHWLRWPAKFLPYNYYHPVKILSGEFTWHEATGMVIFVLLCAVVSWLGFRRRDIG